MSTPAYAAQLPGQDQAAPVTPETYVSLACDPAACVVVSACAGAGKTWLLVARLARCLLDGCAPQDVLAITFTRKAAAEMQQRLLELLQGWSQLDDAALAAELAHRGLPHADAVMLQRARALYPTVLAGGTQTTISTFHGWFAQLLRAAPLRFGIPLHFELIENEQPWVQQAWRMLFDKLQAEPELRADYRALVARTGRSTAAQLMELVVQRRGEFMLAAQAGTLARGLDAAEPESWPAWRTRNMIELRLWAQAWGVCGGAHAREALLHLQAALDASDAQAVGALLRKVMLTAQGGARSARNLVTKAVQHEMLRLGLQDDPVGRWDTLASDYLSVVQAHDALDIETIHAWALRLGAQLLGCYEQLKAEGGLLDFSDLELHARTLLADADVSAWVQTRLDRRYRQVLIDEFQDTNPVQWQALQAWLSAYAGDAQRPSVFIVGDDKQSIYRFRRADPQVFEAAASFLRQGFGAVLLSAQHTRRLSLAVMDWVNAVFAQAPAMAFIAHTTESRVRGLTALLPALATDTDVEAMAATSARIVETTLRVRDSLTEPDVDAEIGKIEHDAQRVAALLRELMQRPCVEDTDGCLRPARPGDVLLLLRKRKDRMDLYLRALLAAGIPAAAGDSQASLLDTIEARDLLALLGVLVSPGANLDLAQVLKSPIGGLADDDLLTLARCARETRQSWWQAAQTLAARDPTHFALRRFMTLAEGWVALLDKLPPHDLLDRIVAEGQLHQRYAQSVPETMRAQSLAQIDAFVHLALDMGGGRFLTPYAFVRQLKRGLARAPVPELHAGESLQDYAGQPQLREGVVRLSTIHGAKGLEANIVILADADSRPAASGPSVLLDWPAGQTHPLHFSLQLASRRLHPAQQQLVQAESEAAEREDWNLLYVAMTRARQQLWVTSLPMRGQAPWSQRLAAPASTASASLADALSSLRQDAAPGSTDSVETRAPATLPATPIEIPWLWRTQAKPAQSPVQGPQADTRATRIGIALHALLQSASATVRPEAVIEALDASGVALQLGLDAGEAQAAMHAALRILRSPQASMYFDAARIRWVRNEVEVAWNAQAADEPGWGRIDRLVELDDAVWVLDYKLAASTLQTEHYAPILARYAQACAGLRPGKRVRVALIAGDGSVLEWPVPEAVNPPGPELA
ncbi:MAG: UvrD-helicase domain-containing protein [Burkholderiales bacterium]|nr:UvrD-helicase domain-containing protein [Burkholderiales bacterium]